jgi:hypothetical protein
MKWTKEYPEKKEDFYLQVLPTNALKKNVYVDFLLL